ncbi:unnamed protein product [Meganyctiphanes norvegica]|uniref:Uncharacterized protein n=1 Tax=Meganyctiphanes norvegica TaxID=48144 RepID=A0AAV2QZX4_MEGNR
MKSICMLVVVLLLCGSTIGDSNYNNPQYGYGPPPPPPSPPKVCYPQKCTDHVVITQPGFTAQTHTNTITNIIPYTSQTLSTFIMPYSIDHERQECESMAATPIYEVTFDSSVKTITHYMTHIEYIPRTSSITIRQCVGGFKTKVTEVTGYNVQSTEVPVTSYSFSTSITELTQYTPTSSMEYLYLCTQTMQCEQGYSQSQYY